MAVKKYLSYDKLQEYDELIKTKIDSGDSTTLSSAKSYADGKVTAITNGSTVVAKAAHAVSADSATAAGSATKATQDGNGKVISEQYETKTDASAKLTEAKSYTDTEVAKKANSIHSHDVATASANGFMSSAMVTKLSDISEGANKTTVDSSLSATSTNPVQNKAVSSALDGKVPTTRKVNGKTLSSDITLSASDVGADASGSASSALANAKTYTDGKIDAIVGTGAATTLDTIGEISAALKGNASIIDTLATKTALDSHTGNADIHVTSAKKANWDAAYTHSQAAHAPSNAEKNQNAFSNVKVGTTTIAADTATDTLTIAGSNVTITPDATNDKVTIGITKDNVTAALGYTPQTSGSYAAASHSHNDLYYTETEIDTKLEGKANATHSHSDATTSAAGFMTAAMVTKLNGIATGATKVTVDASLSSSSTNPVQNKAVNTAIGTLTSSVGANTSSINSHTTAISNLQTAVSEFTEITSSEISALFA